MRVSLCRVGGIGVTSLLIKSTSRTVTSSGVATRREYAAAMSCLRGARPRARQMRFMGFVYTLPAEK